VAAPVAAVVVAVEITLPEAGVELVGLELELDSL